MKLLLSSKDCVRFGIMKGCPCRLRDIVFSDYEVLPSRFLAGRAHSLRFMPISLLLQAADVDTAEAEWVDGANHSQINVVRGDAVSVFARRKFSRIHAPSDAL